MSYKKPARLAGLMRLGAITTTLLLLTAGLAGCLGGEEDGTANDGEGPDEGFHPRWYENALASGSDHDHLDPAQHANMTTPNFQTLGHDPLVTELDGTSPGGSSCGDARTAGNRTLGAQKMADSRGVVLVDLTDPARPAKIGELVLTSTHIYDVAVVPDGQHLALVTAQPKEGPLPDPTGLPPAATEAGPEAPAATWTSTCAGTTTELALEGAARAAQDPVPRPTSLLLVDLSEPAQPQVVDQRPITGLGHGVIAHQTEDATWVAAITESIAQGTKHLHLYGLTDTPAGTVLEPLSIHAAQPRQEHADALVGHSDAWFQQHPGTGQVLAYFAAGTVLEIVDYSDPATPQLVGTWTDMRGDRPVDHNIHSAHPLPALRNGTHYTVVGPELGGPPENGAPSGTVWVLDTTEPADPREVAAWTLPTEVSWSGSLQFSTHYLTVYEDTLFVSMYHGGIWAVDLAGIGQGSPEAPVLLPSIGVFVPTAPQAPAPEGYGFAWTPNLEEVFALDDGTLVTFDSNSGVHTFTFDAGTPAPAPAPWPLDPLPPANGPMP